MNKLKSFLYILLREHVSFGPKRLGQLRAYVEGIVNNQDAESRKQQLDEDAELLAYVDSLVSRLLPPPSHLPKEGDIVTVAGAVAVVKEGCRQALDEAKAARQPGKVGSFTQPAVVYRRTVIVALPPGRRKYVKLFLKGLGFTNLDKIPTTTEQKPYDLGCNFLSASNRERLISLAPNIVLRDVP